MTDDELKRLLETSAAETRRHFDTALERIDARVTGVASAVEGLDGRLSGVVTVVEGLDDRLSGVVTVVEGLDGRVTGVDRKIDSVAAEMRRHFDVTVEHFDNKIQLIAETVAQFDEKFDRKIGDLDERLERGFAETQAMIKFSHAELDHRVHALENGHRTLEEGHRLLEETVADLQARLERLESSTH